MIECLLCNGELEIISSNGINKKVKCLRCGFTNEEKSLSKKILPEIIVIRKKI